MKKLKELFRRFKRELQLYRNIMADPRTPRITKILLGCAVAYAVSPVDIIPDFIPIIGHLDDAIIVPVLIYFALKTIPPALLIEHRQAIHQCPGEALQRSKQLKPQQPTERIKNERP